MSDLVVLVVEDDAGLREALCDTLLLAGYAPLAANCAEQALLLLKKQKVQLVVSDVQMGSVSGLNLLQTLNEHYPQLPVLLMTAYANVQDAVEAMRLGAIDYLSKPFSPEVLVSMVSRYVKAASTSANQPIVADPKSLALLQLAEKVARSEASVMILGPSGSGKEVLARYIHQQSSRSSEPFVAINCAAIPENMLEATLFGYEKGAFTGAVNACPGKFEQANGGTLLLDEVTEMPLNLQAKLLRVIQEREVERLGGRKLIKLDIRILATSNRELRQAVNDGVLREDLYYRLNVFPLCWPALSERPGDILPLAEHLLARYARQQERSIPSLTAAAKQRLVGYNWPGNVRELDNVMQRALILQSGSLLEANDILLESHPFVPSAANQHPEMLAEESHFKAEIHQQEHKLILATMRACDHKRKEAAARLGISDRTLRYKLARMRELGIEVA